MRAARLVVPALASVALAAACGEDPPETPGEPELHDGTYVRGDATVDPSSCGEVDTPFYAQFSTVSIAIARPVLVASFGDAAFHHETTYEIDGTDLRDPRSPGSVLVDLTDPVVAVTNEGFASTFDCVLDVTIEWAGVITSDDHFTLSDVYRVGISSGAECGIVQQSSGLAAIPCEDSANTSWAP